MLRPENCGSGERRGGRRRNIRDSILRCDAEKTNDPAKPPHGKNCRKNVKQEIVVLRIVSGHDTLPE
jgi:hypothetical protein